MQIAAHVSCGDYLELSYIFRKIQENRNGPLCPVLLVVLFSEGGCPKMVNQEEEVIDQINHERVSSERLEDLFHLEPFDESMLGDAAGAFSIATVGHDSPTISGKLVKPIESNEDFDLL